MKRNNVSGDEVFDFFMAYIFFGAVIVLITGACILLLINDPLAFGICAGIAAVIVTIYYLITHTTWGEKLVKENDETYSD